MEIEGREKKERPTRATPSDKSGNEIPRGSPSPESVGGCGFELRPRVPAARPSRDDNAGSGRCAATTVRDPTANYDISANGRRGIRNREEQEIRRS